MLDIAVEHHALVEERRFDVAVLHDVVDTPELAVVREGFLDAEDRGAVEEGDAALHAHSRERERAGHLGANLAVDTSRSETDVPEDLRGSAVEVHAVGHFVLGREAETVEEEEMSLPREALRETHRLDERRPVDVQHVHVAVGKAEFSDGATVDLDSDLSPGAGENDVRRVFDA